MPVDLFPEIRMPVVVVATFYAGMPAAQIETSITSRFERFFTLASHVDHIESRSLPGVSLIKVYFKAGTDADLTVSAISNLAMANLRRLPVGTLPPVVLKFDAAAQPVCLVTLGGKGLGEAALRDTAQYSVRNQLAGVAGASVPQPFGGKYRQVMVYIDPGRLDAHQLTPMDVVQAVNSGNVILPAGSVRIGSTEYPLIANGQLDKLDAIARIPVSTVGGVPILVGDVGTVHDGAQIQSSIVRIGGQPSVYLPVLKQGGDSNTIEVVDGVRKIVADLVDVPAELVTKVVFDQSRFVKASIKNIIHEAGMGLFLTGLMILLFLGNARATVAIFLSIPLSALAAFTVLGVLGQSINVMVLAGLALAFSRLIDNSVVVLENIFRHMEKGASARDAALVGGREVALPVLAETIGTCVVFFPVSLFPGVSKFLFGTLGLTVVLSLLASYLVAMSVIPLFCALFIVRSGASSQKRTGRVQATLRRVHTCFSSRFNELTERVDYLQASALRKPALVVAAVLALTAASALLVPAVGVAFFPRTDAGQFVINVKAPVGSRLELTAEHVRRVEEVLRKVVPAKELDLVVSNIGMTPDLAAIYTSNAASHTATVQVSLTEDHATDSYLLMQRVTTALDKELPELSVFLQSGGLIDSTLNRGLLSPIDVQVTGSDLQENYRIASKIAQRARAIPDVEDVLIPQDLDAPALKLEIDRIKAGLSGLTVQEIISNVITALTSNSMIAPGYWIDPRSGTDYLLTVQYPENTVRSLIELEEITSSPAAGGTPVRVDAVSTVSAATASTEIDHFGLRRMINLYVQPRGEEIGRTVDALRNIVKSVELPPGVRVSIRGAAEEMEKSFASFGSGLVMALLLVYLILMAQFRSFVDPLLILLAVPPSLIGVVLLFLATGTTFNIMSLMGMILLSGIVISNSILIVDVARRAFASGLPATEAARHAVRIRLRPIAMTSFATLIGLLPLGLKLGTGSEAYAPLALAIIGGLGASLLLTIFIVPAAFVFVYGRVQPMCATSVTG